MLDVEAAGGHVGRNQQVGASFAKELHHTVALPLHHPAVQRLRAMPADGQRLGQRIHFVTRAAKDDRRLGFLELQHLRERRRFAGARHDVAHLSHERHRALCRLLARQRHAGRVGEMALGDRRDPRGDGRREQRRLPRRRRRIHDRLEIFGEPHVEHLVGLVEHEHLEAVQLQRRTPHVIERAPRRGDDDVDAPFEGAELLIHGGAAVDRDDREADPFGVLLDRFGYLHRELARRHEHEPAHAARARRTVSPNPVEHRQRERRRLAGAGGCLPDQIPSGEQHRDRFSLNRRRLFIAKRRHGGHQRGGQPERGESPGISVVGDYGFVGSCH